MLTVDSRSDIEAGADLALGIGVHQLGEVVHHTAVLGVGSEAHAGHFEPLQQRADQTGGQRRRGAQARLRDLHLPRSVLGAGKELGQSQQGRGQQRKVSSLELKS